MIFSYTNYVTVESEKAKEFLIVTLVYQASFGKFKQTIVKIYLNSKFVSIKRIIKMIISVQEC